MSGPFLKHITIISPPAQESCFFHYGYFSLGRPDRLVDLSMTSYLKIAHMHKFGTHAQIWHTQKLIIQGNHARLKVLHPHSQLARHYQSMNTITALTRTMQQAEWAGWSNGIAVNKPAVVKWHYIFHSESEEYNSFQCRGYNMWFYTVLQELVQEIDKQLLHA